METTDIELRALPSHTQEQFRNVTHKHGVGDTSTSPRSSITAREPTITHIHTLLWPVLVFLVYATFAFFPWITLCILSKRPIRGEKAYESLKTVSHHPEHWYDVSEKYSKVAQIFQSIATLVTIPMTTAICSMACVVYLQAGHLRRSLTLRQSMALADSGWLSPRTWGRIETMGSLPLYVAFAMTLFGSVGQVLQNAFVDQIPVLATSGGPYSTFDYTYVYDTLGLVNGTYDARMGGDRTDFGQRTLNLRSLFESPFTANDDINNWGVPYDPYEGKYVYSSDRRHEAGHTYVPLVNNFTSGVFPLQQFAPQINSSVAFANITEAEFREKCRNETNDGGFYARYYYVEQSIVQDDTYYDPDVDFEVCMTNDLRVSPWNMTRDRQDITEELYYKTLSSSSRDATYWKITSATSLGYFEVPSERNGRVAGPLLDKDPFSNDKVQIEKNRLAYYKDTHLYRRGINISYSGNATMNLSGYNKGPLASVAVALFGPYSFIGARMSNPSAFVLAPDAVSSSGRLIGSGNCVYKRPLASWTANSAAACFEHYGSTDVHMVIQQVTQTLYFWTESYLDDTLEALSHALFMANKLWLNQPTAGYDTENQLRIYYDAGIPTTKPEISNTGIIVGSLFMALHLLGLLLLTIYIVMVKPWSGKLGSEIILKMGMVYSDELARSETEDQWKRTVVRLPGYIGDERPEEVIGRLRFGAAAGLSTKKDRRFEILR